MSDILVVNGTTGEKWRCLRCRQNFVLKPGDNITKTSHTKRGNQRILPLELWTLLKSMGIKNKKITCIARACARTLENHGMLILIDKQSIMYVQSSCLPGKLHPSTMAVLNLQDPPGVLHTYHSSVETTYYEGH